MTEVQLAVCINFSSFEKKLVHTAYGNMGFLYRWALLLCLVLPIVRALVGPALSSPAWTTIPRSPASSLSRSRSRSLPRRPVYAQAKPDGLKDGFAKWPDLKKFEKKMREKVQEIQEINKKVRCTHDLTTLR